jgi:cytolysin-activating lysine-acyltransferase
MSVAFADIVSVLMCSPLHKHFSLTDLEWLVVPPLLAGQCRVAKAQPQGGGLGTPVAVVLWASVSAEVDNRLSSNVNAPIRLRPDEWRSGDILWLVEAVGDQRVVPPLLKQLTDTAFKGHTVKMRRLEGGKPAVRSLADVLATRQKDAEAG